MSLTIELPPELERRLEQEAARRGQAPEEFARMVLQERLAAAPAPTESPLLPGGVRPRSPAELLAMARQQGVGPVERFEDLLGNFWPEDESVDDFLEARRQWQREGQHGIPWE